MRERFKLWKKMYEDKELFYTEFGKETHGRPSFKLWVENSLAESSENVKYLFITLPKQNVNIEEINEKNLILKKGNYNLFKIYTECGFRGSSEIEVISPAVKVYKFTIYKSERGSLGRASGALVLTKEICVKWKWRRNGRLYGSPSKGISIINLNGYVRDLDENIDEIKKLLSS